MIINYENIIFILESVKTSDQDTDVYLAGSEEKKSTFDIQFFNTSWLLRNVIGLNLKWAIAEWFLSLPVYLISHILVMLVWLTGKTFNSVVHKELE